MSGGGGSSITGSLGLPIAGCYMIWIVPRSLMITTKLIRYCLLINDTHYNLQWTCVSWILPSILGPAEKSFFNCGAFISKFPSSKDRICDTSIENFGFERRAVASRLPLWSHAWDWTDVTSLLIILNNQLFMITIHFEICSK